MNKKSEMYGVVYMIQFPGYEDPKMKSLELFSSFDEAVERSEEIIKEFKEEYDIDYVEHATREKPVTIMDNGEVTGYVYIVETQV